MYEDKSNADHYPVNIYLAYKEHQPTSMMTDESPFYLAVKNPKRGQMWFNCSPLGVNSLRSMLKNMIRDLGLETDKNCSRKHLLQKLVDNDIPPNEIIQITGHKNFNSINNYSSLSDKKQQQVLWSISSFITHFMHGLGG